MSQILQISLFPGGETYLKSVVQPLLKKAITVTLDVELITKVANSTDHIGDKLLCYPW